jgi:type I restriction enzyme S subunit
MARAIFKSWFVDCDPVRAKMDGRRPACMDAATAALFPDAFEDSELGEIPKGWSVGTIGDVAHQTRRGVRPEDMGPETPYIGLEHMPRRSISLSEWGAAADVSSAKSGFRRGEILFGKLRPYFHKVGVALLNGVGSTDIVVVLPREEPWFGFTLGHLSSDQFVAHADATSTGTKMPRTNWEAMARYPVALPPVAIAEAYSRLVLPFIDLIHSHVFESRSLAAIRDALLPRLLSGEIRVPDDVRPPESAS